MNGLRFRLRTLLVVVAASALALAAVEWKRKRDRPRPLRPEDGPFLVLAHTFRGETAESQASSLAASLQAEHGLPAFLYRPPRVPQRRQTSGLRPDQVLVLVGHAPTIDEAERLVKPVRKALAKSLSGVPGGVSKASQAWVTVNPTTATPLVPK